MAGQHACDVCRQVASAPASPREQQPKLFEAAALQPESSSKQEQAATEPSSVEAEASHQEAARSAEGPASNSTGRPIQPGNAGPEGRTNKLEGGRQGRDTGANEDDMFQMDEVRPLLETYHTNSALVYRKLCLHEFVKDNLDGFVS